MDINRYYGKTYSDELCNSLTKVSGSLCTSKYSSSISKISVQKKRQALYSGCITVASNAYDRVDTARKKIEYLGTVIQRFYGEVDDSALEIIDVANDIVAIVTESNATLSKMCDILQTAGAYSGRVVTPSSLSSVGLDKDKCNQHRRNALEKILNIGIKHNHKTLNELAITEFLNSIKIKYEEDPLYELTEEEVEKLNNIYNCYLNNRFGETGDIRDMDMQSVQNLIDVYELLNPEAKEITDEFFHEILAWDDPVTTRNVLRVKFSIYTASPEYRDIMLYYLPKINQLRLDNPKSQYNPYFNVLYVDLSKNYDEMVMDQNGNYIYVNDRPVGSFFHELGHAIDDLSDLVGCSSSGLRESLEKDLSDSMRSYLINWSDTNLYYTLSEKDIQEIIDYMLSSKNPNVDIAGGDGSATKALLPSSWTNGQIDAYFYLRSVYGYRGYILENDGSVSENNDNMKTQYLQDGYNYGILKDLLGGLTNNKIGGCYHAWVLPDNYSAKDLVKIVKDLSSYNYWKDSLIQDHVDEEFFAEMFEYNVMDIDKTPTQELFNDASDEFRKIVWKIYENL